MTVADVLKEIRDLISDPSYWVQNHYAVDKYDKAVNATDPKACRWCLAGAWTRVTYFPNRIHSDVIHKSYDVIKNGVGIYGFEQISAFNDSRKTTHEKVMNVLNTMIAVTE